MEKLPTIDFPKAPPSQFNWFTDRLPSRATGAQLTSQGVTVTIFTCFHGAPDVVEGGRTYRFADYCSAPEGVRCGHRRDGHDLGDEDPRSP